MVFRRANDLKLTCSMTGDKLLGFVPESNNMPDVREKYKHIFSNLRLYNLLARRGVSPTQLLTISVEEARAGVEWSDPPSSRLQCEKVPEYERLKTNGCVKGLPKNIGMFIQMSPDDKNTPYVAKHTVAHQRILMKWRGVMNLDDISPNDSHVELRIVKNLKLYRKAIASGVSPQIALTKSPAELQQIMEYSMTHCQLLVFSATQPEFDVSNYTKEHKINYGELADKEDTKSLDIELFSWVDYLRTGDYSTVKPLTPFYYDVVIKLTGDKPLFDPSNPLHEAIIHGTNIESHGANFLVNVNRYMPWHPPIIANPKKRESDRIITQSVPTWPLTSHWEIMSFFRYVQQASRFSKYYNDALKSHEDHRVMKDQFARLMKTNKDIFVRNAKTRSKPLNFNPNIKTPNTFNICVKVEFERGGPYGQLTCFASKLRQDRGSLNQMLFNTGDKNSKIEGLYADKPSLRKYVNVPSSKLPTLTREECIAIFTLGRRLFSTYEPKLFHVDKFEMDQLRKA